MQSLTIRIVATFQSSACLANIQIWGKPSWGIDQKIRKEIKSIWLALIKAKTIQNKDEVPSYEERKEEKTSQKRNFADLDSIPEEFLDALTCKRM